MAETRKDTFYGAESKRLVGGSPPLPKKEGDMPKNRLVQGQSDRYGTVGDDQVGGSFRPFPPYPNRGGNTFMINLAAITSAIAAPLNAVKGLILSPLSGNSIPVIGQITQNTASTLKSTTNAITGAISGSTQSVLGNIGNTLNASNALSTLSGKARNVLNTVNTIPSYNQLNNLPSFVNSANTVKSIIGNANSITDLNNRLNNALNSSIRNSFTNPITSTVNNATYGINQIKNMLEVNRLANNIGNIIGTNNIGGKVANEIRSLTGDKFGTGLISFIPGATAAASLIDLIGNQMGLGGILSDLACNENSNFELAIDNPLDDINKSLENLKKSLESLINNTDLSNLGNRLIKNMNLDAINDALNQLLQMPNCQMIAKSALAKSSIIASKAKVANTSTPKSWK